MLYPTWTATFRMKLTASICLSLALLGTVSAAEPPPPADQQLLAVVKEIQAQQVQIAKNQTDIEAKLATVAEAVRVARIYSSRAGH